jgi:hypothetical protein
MINEITIKKIDKLLEDRWMEYASASNGFCPNPNAEERQRYENSLFALNEAFRYAEIMGSTMGYYQTIKKFKDCCGFLSPTIFDEDSKN